MKNGMVQGFYNLNNKKMLKRHFVMIEFRVIIYKVNTPALSTLVFLKGD